MPRREARTFPEISFSLSGNKKRPLQGAFSVWWIFIQLSSCKGSTGSLA
jgi:hypothetical protein